MYATSRATSITVNSLILNIFYAKNIMCCINKYMNYSNRKIAIGFGSLLVVE
jgi:hypothetical protein